MLSSVYMYCFVLTTWATLVATQETTSTMTIPLNKNISAKNRELFGDFIYLEQLSSLEVNFTNTRPNLSFIVFQVHSHLYDVTLTNSSSAVPVVGTNVGLVSMVKNGIILQKFTIHNPNNLDLKLFVGVYGYRTIDPIPGACNMEFLIPIAPFMKTVLHNKSYIDVEATTPGLQDYPCNQQYSFLRFYMLYLPECNYNSDVYFEGIRNMTTINNIVKYGRLIPESSALYWATRRRISAYPGTGAIFVAIAQRGEMSAFYSVYVPTHSYGCSPLLEYDCELLDDSLTMLLNSGLFFLGIFICYLGHRFFKTQIVSLGFLSGFVVTYIILSTLSDIDGPALVIASAMSGLVVGGFRFVCWWLYSVPAFIIVLSSADVGFLIASILYYISPGGVYLQPATTFWTVFMLIVFITVMSLLSMSYIACLICCAVIGAYAAIYPLDYFIGSNLKYILNNAVRRASVPNFNKAVIMPIFQWRDILLSFLWLALAVSGFMYQYYYNRGRPPFPPPPRSVRAVPELPVEAVVRRRSSIARYWEKWLQRRRNTRSNLRNTINERTPLIEEE